MELYEEIGYRIARKREEKGLSQAKLAEEIGISQALLAKIETGARRLQIDTLADIANALDTDCDYLIRGVNTAYLSAEQLGITNPSADILKRIVEQAEGDDDPNPAILLLNGLHILLTTTAGRQFLSRIELYTVADFKRILGICDASETITHSVRLDRILLKTPPEYPYANLPTDCLESAYLQNLTNLLQKVRQEEQLHAPQK